MRVLVAYVPVLHEGYLRFFKKYADSVDAAYVVSASLVDQHKFLEREIRALDPITTRSLVESLGLFREVRLLDETSAQALNTTDVEVITPDEQLSLRIAAAHFPKATLITDSIFLRWDEASVLSQHMPDAARISEDPFDISMIQHGAQESAKSSDWWRHVGAVVVREGAVLLEDHNAHVPSDHTPYANGDPRDVVKAGTNPQIATAMHAEQRVITEAAKQGLRLEGATIYSTVFPCAMCAKMIAYSGFKTCYYASGHASLDGESIMKANGVDLVFVKMPEQPSQ